MNNPKVVEGDINARRRCFKNGFWADSLPGGRKNQIRILASGIDKDVNQIFD